VRVLVADVREGRVPDRPAFPALPARPAGPFADLDRQLVLLAHVVRDAVVQAGAADSGTATAELRAFASIARRLRARADRVLAGLDELENATEDPDALYALLQADHKVTQIRRDVDAVQVLAGGRLRQSGGSSEVAAILRQATAETEDYRRVDIGVLAPVQVVAYARSALIHVLAALVENATRYSREQVVLASALQAEGLVVTVGDTGLHMPAEELRVANALLADPDPALVRARLMEGRIGLLVTATLARQYGLTVTLHPGGETGGGRGTRAVVLVPPNLLLPLAPAAPAVAPEPPAGPVPRHASAAAAAATVRPGSTALSGVEIRPAPASASSPSMAQDGPRPGLPRRRRSTAGETAVGGAHARRPAVDAGPAAASSAGLAGAFLQGRRKAGGPPPAVDAAPAPEPPPS
jgi:hypothetical protein